MQELKPCPFCGGEAQMVITEHTPKGNDYTPRCSNPACAGRITKKWINYDKAVEAWNRRVEG